MKLIAFSGKKQSGKDSACRFLKANAGKLFPVAGPSGLQRPPGVETFYVGGPMKEFAKTFGVPHELVWGDDTAKNTLIDIEWETLPHYQRLVLDVYRKLLDDPDGGEKYKDRLWDELVAEHLPSGRMTARQFLQQIGEEMFLGMKPSYWVDQFKTAVRASTADVGLVADPRKPEQIAAIRELGGITVRLTRDPYEGKDQHISETALDPDKYDWANFDEVVDNRTLTVAETNAEVLKRLVARGWVKPLSVNERLQVCLNPQHATVA